MSSPPQCRNLTSIPPTSRYAALESTETPPPATASWTRARWPGVRSSIRSRPRTTSELDVGFSRRTRACGTTHGAPASTIPTARRRNVELTHESASAMTRMSPAACRIADSTARPFDHPCAGAEPTLSSHPGSCSRYRSRSHDHVALRSGPQSIGTRTDTLPIALSVSRLATSRRRQTPTDRGHRRSRPTDGRVLQRSARIPDAGTPRGPRRLRRTTARRRRVCPR